MVHKLVRPSPRLMRPEYGEAHRVGGAIWDDLAWTERDDRVLKIEDAAAGHLNGKCRGASPTSHLRSAALPIAAVFVVT